MRRPRATTVGGGAEGHIDPTASGRHPARARFGLWSPFSQPGDVDHRLLRGSAAADQAARIRLFYRRQHLGVGRRWAYVKRSTSELQRRFGPTPFDVMSFGAVSAKPASLNRHEISSVPAPRQSAMRWAQHIGFSCASLLTDVRSDAHNLPMRVLAIALANSHQAAPCLMLTNKALFM